MDRPVFGDFIVDDRKLEDDILEYDRVLEKYANHLEEKITKEYQAVCPDDADVFCYDEDEDEIHIDLDFEYDEPDEQTEPDEEYLLISITPGEHKYELSVEYELGNERYSYFEGADDLWRIRNLIIDTITRIKP